MCQDPCLEYHFGPLCLLLLVRQDANTRRTICAPLIFAGSSGNLPLFCSCRSSACPTPNTSTVARCSPHSSSPKWDTSLPRLQPLRINLNIDGAPIASRSHTHPSLSNLSPLNLVSIFRCSSPPRNPVYARRVDPSALAL